MDEVAVQAMLDAIEELTNQVRALTSRNDELNDTMLRLIETLNTNSQELLEIKEEMQRKK